MTGEKFEKIVKARAEQQVQKKIREFKKKCCAAANELYRLHADAIHFKEYPEKWKVFFFILASTNNTKGWPKELWEDEEDLVTNELLGTLPTRTESPVTPSPESFITDEEIEKGKERDKKEGFVKKADHYLDTQTSLQWSLENAGPMDWDKAMAYAQSLGNGWRLPSIEELRKIRDGKLHDPVTLLPGMLSKCYWSGTTNADSTDYAWSVYFYYSSALNPKSYDYYVRCVRDGGE